MVKCLICGREFASKDPVASHVIHFHKISSKEYYDKYIHEQDGCCLICGCPTKFNGIFKGYNRFCSASCSGKFGSKRCMEKYGVSSPAKLQSSKDAAKKHFEEKYGEGITAPAQVPEILLKQQKTIKERYNVSNAFLVKNDDGTIKRDITNFRKYGYKCAMQDPFKKEKIIEKKLEQYGNKNNYEKIQNTIKNRYGVNNSFLVKDENGNLKRCSTYLKKYGCENPSQNSEIHKKQMFNKYYAPNNKWYDSSWEYAYEQYLIKEHIPYIHQPNSSFKWVDVDGKLHTYIPDFLLLNDNTYIEIKGDHFFDKFGNYQNPYDMSEKGKANAALKYKCMQDAGVKIITNKEFNFIEYLRNMNKKIT